jgi:hypothetical protein
VTNDDREGGGGPRSGRRAAEGTVVAVSGAAAGWLEVDPARELIGVPVEQERVETGQAGARPHEEGEE